MVASRRVEEVKAKKEGWGTSKEEKVLKKWALGPNRYYAERTFTNGGIVYDRNANTRMATCENFIDALLICGLLNCYSVADYALQKRIEELANRS